MLRASVDTILSVTNGELLAGEADGFTSGLMIDSRECVLGCVYVAVIGARVDGHDYLRDALERGARVLLVTRGREELLPALTYALKRNAAVIRVDDPLAAVQRLATYHRSRLLCPVVAISGSTGKTTTKDFIRAVLATEMRVVSTVGNRNNEWGVPLTVLSAGTDVDVVVIEMGMRGLGQIAALCEIAKPTLGILTNVGTSHVEVLGSVEAIRHAKGELVQAIPGDGAVFLNGDDDATAILAGASCAPVTRYGIEDGNDIRATDIELDDTSHARFTLVTPQGDIGVRLPVPGRHNVYNALAAAAVGLRLAVPLSQVAQGLAGATFSGMRMETVATASGVTILNDAYNANPVSMKAAVETLGAMRPTGRRIAILGDMAELGGLTDLAHFEIGELVARTGIEGLITVGRRSRRIVEGARAEGMPDEALRCCESADEALVQARDMVVEGDVVLVKASRVMGLEAVVEGMVSPDAG